MTNIRPLVVLTCVLSALASCVSQPVYNTAEEVAAATRLERDDYAKTTWVKSPLVRYGRGFDRCFLRTLVADSGVQLDQLYVIHTPIEWAFLDRANDSDGRALEVTVIDRDVSSSQYGVSLAEHVAVALDREYLQEAAGKGLDIKVRGNHGSTIVVLPPHFVQGYLERLNTFVGQL